MSGGCDEDAYRAYAAGVVLSHVDPKERPRANQLLDHLRELCECGLKRHQQIMAECSNYILYVLHATAELPPNLNLVLNIFNESSLKQQTINTGETYRIELGPHRNYRVRFAVAKFNGENRNAVVRSGSFMKRLMSLDKKEGDSVFLSSLPINAMEKKCVSIRGHCYNAEMKITIETLDSLAPKLKYDHMLWLTTAVHESEANQFRLSGAGEYDGELGDSSFSLLYAVASYYHVPAVIMKIAAISTFLVWDSAICPLDGALLQRLITQLRTLDLKDLEHPMMADALNHLFSCVQNEQADVLQRFQEERLFPPTGHIPLKKINTALKTVVDICVLSLWDHHNGDDPSLALSQQLEEMLRNSALSWLDNDLQDASRDIKKICLCILSMWEDVQRHNAASSLFFHQFNVDFLRVTLTTIDEKLESSARAYLSNKVSQLNSRDASQLEIFAKCTMRFYESIGSLSHFALENRVGNLRLHGYESWFEGITAIWTYSWRQLTRSMIGRLKPLTEDTQESHPDRRRPLPSALYSFLCIQKGIADDYSMLGFCKAENIMMGSVALIHIFCENTCAYAKKIFTEAISHSAGHSRCTLVRAANGIEQALEYIEDRWQRFVDWDRAASKLDNDERKAIENVAKAVLKSTRKRCDELISGLVKLYCSYRREELEKIARSICLDNAEYTSTFKSYIREVTPLERMNATLEAVDALADDVCGQLLPGAFKFALKRLFETLENELHLHMKARQPHDYYGHIYVTWKTVMEMLQLDSRNSTLIHGLHYRSFSTEELLLAYYAQLSEMTLVPTSSTPNLNLTVGSIPAAGDNMLIVITVHDVVNFPALNHLCDRMDAFVKLELLPLCLFPEPSFQPHKTKLVVQSDRLEWNQTFQLLIPQTLFFKNGSVMCVSLMDHDRFCDQLLGRAFIRLSRLGANDTRRPLSLSVPMMKPSICHTLVYFQMLKERSKYDRVARHFCRRERTAKEMYSRVKRFSYRVVKNKCL